MSAVIILGRYFPNTAASHVRVSKQQRVYIFPTAHGWIYGLMLFLMLLGAVNYSNSMAFVLCFLLTGLGLTSMLYTHRNLSGLLISAKKPGAVHAGQTALFPVYLDNLSGSARFAIQIQRFKPMPFFKWFGKTLECEKISITIDAGKSLLIHYPCPVAERGLFNPGTLMLSSCFPLGIFNAWAYFEPDEDCIVYPRPGGRKQLPPAREEDSETGLGERDGADDFTGFRKYHPGDPIHSISWKAFARERGLLIKQFSGAGVDVLILTWQSVSHLGDIETRLSQLCYWIILSDEAGIQYGLELPNVKIEPACGSGHKALCLEQLARYGKTG